MDLTCPALLHSAFFSSSAICTLLLQGRLTPIIVSPADMTFSCMMLKQSSPEPQVPSNTYLPAFLHSASASSKGPHGPADKGPCCRAGSWPLTTHLAQPAIKATSCMMLEQSSAFWILLAGFSAFCLLQRVHSRHTAAIGQAHAHSLDSTGHGVGSVHAPTCSCSRTCIANNIMHLLLAHQAGCVCACKCTQNQSVEHQHVIMAEGTLRTTSCIHAFIKPAVYGPTQHVKASVCTASRCAASVCTASAQN